MSRKTVFSIAAVSVALGIGIAGYLITHRGGTDRAGHVHTVQGTYLCPMHPEIVQDKPGKCPICAMDLQLSPMKRETPAKHKILYYRHPMRPEVTSPTPKKDARGMDYLPVYADEESKSSSDVVEGRALTGLNLNQQQLIGIKTDTVQKRSLIKTVYTYGRVAYDPELYHAQEEYLAALEIQKSSEESPLEQSWRRGRVLLESARTRLRLLGLSNAQIQKLEEKRIVDTRLLLGPEGIGNVWVYADVYESDLAFVKEGQRVEVSAQAYPGHTFSGRIVAIDPVLNPKTRSVRIRAEIMDRKSRLKPEFFVDVVIHASLGKWLAVPETAVLDSGTYQLVFVDLGEGNFEPRKVRLGRRAEGYHEILGGLKEGEKVVTNGNFLLDAESQLRGAAASMTFYKGKEAAE